MNNFYEDNHYQYFNSTVGIDPSPVLTPLAECLQPGASIFDIGCGSGRDLLWFKQRGFNITGLEQSPGLAALARNHAGCRVIEDDYLTFDFTSIQVDAVALIGALVHQPREAVPQIVTSICRCLNPGGYLLITQKESSGEMTRPDVRTFTLWSKDEAESVYRGCGLEIVDFSRQISKLRSGDIWLGHVLRRSGR